MFKQNFLSFQACTMFQSHLLDHWNSISKFLEGPLLLSGNRVYSPDTAPSITTRSIWIVTFPNELCHRIKILIRSGSVWAKWVKMNRVIYYSSYLSHFTLVFARNMKLLAFRRTFKGPWETLIPLWIGASWNHLSSTWCISNLAYWCHVITN